jgi:hypothetical protein
VSGLDDPTARPPAGVAQLEVDLLAAGADVWRQVVVAEQIADL